MATQDKPIKTSRQPEQSVDAPIKGKLPMETPKAVEDSMAIESAYMEQYIRGTDIVDNYLKFSREVDKESTRKQLAAQKQALDEQDVREELVENPYFIDQDVESTINATDRALATLGEEGADPDLKYTESALGEEGTIEDAKNEAAKVKMQKMLKGWTERVGTTDKIMELGKMFLVPGLESIRGANVTGSYFGAKEEFQGMVMAFKNDYTPEEQAAMLPALKAELEDKVGSVDAINLLTSFLDPSGAETFDRFGGSEVIWDALDATGVGFAVGAALKAASGGINTVKTLRGLKNYEDSEAAAAVAILDPTIGRAMNIDETTAASNALPFDTSIEVIGRQGGISNKTLDKLDEFFREADEESRKIITSEGYLKEQAVNNKYRVQLENAALDKFQREKAENLRIKSKDENSTTFEYQVLDEDGNLTDETYEMSFTLDEAGTFEQSTMGIIREYLGSPTAFAKNMLREDVKTSQRLDFLTSRINNQLSKLTEKALNPIGLLPTPKTKASLAKVDKALREGDEWKNADDTRGTVFSPDDLREKFSLEENEISAYYRVNRLYNNLWNIRNSEKRAEMETLGYKNINFSRNGDSNIGKNYENALTARAAVSNNSINKMYDAELDQVVDIRDMNSDFMSEAYANNKVMIRMDTPYDLGENRGLYRYALVSADEVGELPQQVLHRKAGYVPRIYEDAAYFVKERKKTTVDGDKEYATTNTLRFFDNKKDADKYKADLVDKSVAARLDEIGRDRLDAAAIAREEEKLREQEFDRFSVLTDREEEQLTAAAGEVSHGSNGLYTGARAQDDILFGLEGSRANRVNSFDSLTRNIGNLSRYASINQWRLGVEQRWINTANEIFKSKGIDTRVESFERLPKTSESNAEVRFLNRVFDQIRDWQNFPTPEEQFFSNIMRGMYDWQANKGRKKMARFLGNFRDADPISAARATAFHSLLGWFNPAHLWVQAQGMATALSLGFGKHMTRSLQTTTALTSLGYGAKSANRYGMTAKASRMDKDELQATHELWLKTGYEDSVLQTADHAAAAKGYGMTMAALKRAADAGLIFYRQGEFLNRRMAFSTALERWKDANKVKTVTRVTDNDLKDIVDDANNIMLNMTRANRASWQKGLPSLPTQFLQVTTKFVETATGLNQNFDRAERARLMMGQIALYGTAGIPLSGLGYMVATEVFGMTQQDIEENPKTFKAINDGFWGVTTMHMFDADIELADRGSLLRGVTAFVDNWFVQESSMAEKFLGAFGSTGQRFWDDTMRRLRPMTISSMAEIDFEDFTDFVVDNPALRTLSSYNNLEKAVIMHRLDAAYSRTGKKVATGFNGWEAIAQGIGFQPTKVTDAYSLNQLNRGMDSSYKKIEGDILNTLNRWAAKYPNADYDDAALAKHEKEVKTLMGLLDPDEKLRAKESIRRNILGDSTLERESSRYIDRMINNTADDANFWMSNLIGTKAIRLGIDTEEEE